MIKEYIRILFERFLFVDNASATRIIRMAVTNRKTLNAFVSSSDALFITFVSDYMIQYTGFQILYFTNNAGETLEKKIYK
jgi:hypothetical protein